MKKYKINMSDHFANVVGQTFVDQLYSKNRARIACHVNNKNYNSKH